VKLIAKNNPEQINHTIGYIRAQNLSIQEIQVGGDGFVYFITSDHASLPDSMTVIQVQQLLQGARIGGGEHEWFEVTITPETIVLERRQKYRRERAGSIQNMREVSRKWMQQQRDRLDQKRYRYGLGSIVHFLMNWKNEDASNHT